jgi:hypothetical protein
LSLDATTITSSVHHDYLASFHARLAARLRRFSLLRIATLLAPTQLLHCERDFVLEPFANLDVLTVHLSGNVTTMVLVCDEFGLDIQARLRATASTCSPPRQTLLRSCPLSSASVSSFPAYLPLVEPIAMSAMSSTKWKQQRENDRDFWVKHGATIPLLSAIYRVVAVIPLSQLLVEHVFSLATFLDDPLSSPKTPAHQREDLMLAWAHHKHAEWLVKM